MKKKRPPATTLTTHDPVTQQGQATRRLYPGQLWHDKDHRWSESIDLEDVYLLLSYDPLRAGGKCYWYAAQFLWTGIKDRDWKGAPVKHLTEEEVRTCYYVGSLSDLISLRSPGSGAKGNSRSEG